MKHTKNILKSLLITVMALSLLAVSCKKDEGGSKPTDPTPITIDAATLTAAIKAAGTAANITDAQINFDALKIGDNGSSSADLEATLSKEITLTTLKKELESGLSFSSAGATATATATVPDKNDVNTAVSVEIKINAGNNTFAEDVKYKTDSKNATVTIKIVPANKKKWNNQ